MESADLEQARAVLRRAAWLRGRGAGLPEALLAEGRLTHLGAGQWAQAEGDVDIGLMVIVTGAVQLFCQAPGDREVLVGQAGPGTAFGQSSRFGGGPRLVTAVCIEDCLVLRVPDRALARIAATWPQIWEAVAALLYLQLRGVVQLVVAAVALPPRQRLAQRLAMLAPAGPSPTVLRLSQQALAEMLGLTRKTVNAYLARFERERLVSRAYGRITLLDLPRLRRVAAS